MGVPDGEALLTMRLGGPDTTPRASLDDVAARARTGDPQAFRELLERHERRVLRTALRLLGNREDAQDAAQEVFVRLYRFLDRLDPARPIEPWLYQMTLNVCRDVARKRNRWFSAFRKRPMPDDVALNPAGRRVDLEIERQVAEEGLRTLSERERAALTLRDIEGLSTHEVAAIMEVTELTVRSLISRARVKLKRFRDRRLGQRHEL